MSRRRVLPKGREPGVLELQSFGPGEEFEILRVRAGVARFDIIDAVLVEQRENLQLVFDRKRNTFGLRSVAQGGIKYGDLVCNAVTHLHFLVNKPNQTDPLRPLRFKSNPAYFFSRGYNRLSRIMPPRLMTRRNWSSASIWIWRTRSRVKLRSAATSSSVLMSPATQTVTALKNPALLFRQLVHPLLDQFTDFVRLQQVFGIDRVVIGNGIGNGVIGVDFQRCIKRRNVFVERQNPAHILDRTINQVRDLLQTYLASIGYFQVPESAQHHVDFLDHMHRQPDGTRLVHDRTLDALANPPGRVGRKTEASTWIEFLNSMDQAEITFFNQVKQRNAAIEIVLGDIYNQPQVVLNHLLPREELTLLRPARPFRIPLPGVNSGLAPISLR